MKSRYILSAALLAGLLFNTSAQATVINFEELPAVAGDWSTPITSQGYKFSGDTFVNTWCCSGGVNGADNGSIYLIYGFGSMHLQQAGGSAFNLNALDIGISYYNSNANDTVTVTGHLAGGGTVSTTLGVTQNFQPAALNWTNLSSADFTVGNGSGYIAVDNVNVSPTPEPETYAMMMLGLGAVGAVARRKKAQ